MTNTKETDSWSFVRYRYSPSIHQFTITTIKFLRRIHFNLTIISPCLRGVDVVEWSRALDVRLSEWCCSVSMVWVQIPSREEQNFDSSKI